MAQQYSPLQGFLMGQKQVADQGAQEVQQAGALMGLLNKARAQHLDQEYRGRLAGAKTDDERLAIATEYSGPDAVMRGITGSKDRMLTAQNTRQLGLSRLQAAATAAENTHQFRMGQLSRQEDRDAEVRRHNGMMESLQRDALSLNADRTAQGADRLYFDTGISRPPTYQPNPAQPAPTGALASQPDARAGVLASILQGRPQLEQDAIMAVERGERGGYDVTANVRGNQASAFTGGGIPTASVMPGLQAGALSSMPPTQGPDSREFNRGGLATPSNPPMAVTVPGPTAPGAAPVAPLQQPAAAPTNALTATGRHYRAALAETVPNEPPKVKFERLAAARKADLEEAKKGTEVSPGDKKYAEVASSESAKNDIEEYKAVKSAGENISKLDTTLKHLKESKAITGVGADLLKNFERLKARFGANGNVVSDTELLDTMLGSDVFPMIGALGIGARGMDTPAEREFLRNVMTGTIQMNKDTLLRLTQMRKDIAGRVIDKWNSRVDEGSLDRFFENNKIPKGKIGGGGIESQVKATGIPYEPNVYDYRVVNGEVQRKKK